MSSVLLQTKGAVLDVALSDPTQVNTTTITMELAASALNLVSADPEVAVERLTPTIRLSFRVAGAAGKSFHARFATARREANDPANTIQVILSGPTTRASSHE